MRWILCGKNSVASEFLEFLVAQGDEVHAVANAEDDGVDGWQRSFRASAEKLGVPVEQPARINRVDTEKRLADLGATALISIQYDQILRRRLFETLGCPCLNLHFALLPRHRGVSPIAWAILEGDSEAGVTLHHMLPEIDAGDVVAQRAVPIHPDDTARDVYDRVSVAALEIVRESYPFARELLERRLAQDEARACYHRQGDFDFSQRRADWSRPAAELQRWLRAMIFPPFQYPEAVVGDRTLRIERVAAELGGPSDAAPGTLLARSAQEIEVAAGGGSIQIRQWTELSDRSTR